MNACAVVDAALSRACAFFARAIISESDIVVCVLFFADKPFFCTFGDKKLLFCMFNASCDSPLVVLRRLKVSKISWEQNGTIHFENNQDWQIEWL